MVNTVKCYRVYAGGGMLAANLTRFGSPPHGHPIVRPQIHPITPLQALGYQFVPICPQFLRFAQKRNC